MNDKAKVAIKMAKISINLNSGEQQEIYADFFKCPNCSKDDIMRFFKYCPYCGMEIEWIGD